MPPSTLIPGSKPAVSPTATALTTQEIEQPPQHRSSRIPLNRAPGPPHPRRVRHADSIHPRERQSRPPIAALDGGGGGCARCERWLWQSSSAASTSLGALLTFWYFSAPETGVAFFPPAGLTLAVLLLTPRRSWPLWLAAVAVAEIWIDLAHGQTIFMAAGFATANVAEPLIGASLFLMAANDTGLAPAPGSRHLRRLRGRRRPLRRRHDRRLHRRDRRKRGLRIDGGQMVARRRARRARGRDSNPRVEAPQLLPDQGRASRDDRHRRCLRSRSRSCRRSSSTDRSPTWSPES